MDDELLQVPRSYQVSLLQRQDLYFIIRVQFRSIYKAGHLYVFTSNDYRLVRSRSTVCVEMCVYIRVFNRIKMSI